jgi:DNA-directed RNA polymerase specialized sigma24 family protein
VQQTFLKAFAAMRGGFRPTVERAWLYRIAENVCADRLRASRARQVDAALAEVLAARPSGSLVLVAGVVRGSRMTFLKPQVC